MEVSSCIEEPSKARSPSSPAETCMSLEPTFSFARNGASIDQTVLSGSSTDRENTFRDRDASQSGVLQLWWGVIQDQLGALTKEVESIRISNSESVAHQFDALKLRSRAQDEKMMESMNLLSQLSQELKNVRFASQAREEKMIESLSRVAPEMNMIRSASHAQEEKIMESMRLITKLGQELKSVKLTAQAEKEECIVACSRLSGMLKTEPAKRAEQFDEVQRGLAQLRENLAEEVRTRQHIFDRNGEKKAAQREELQHGLAQLREHLAEEVRTQQHVLDRQGEKLGQILNAFRNDVQVELDQSRVAIAEIAQHVASLREAVHKVTDKCSVTVNESSVRRLAADIEALKEDQAVHKSRLEAISNDVLLANETWSQHQSDLQQRVLKCLDEQGQLLTMECQSRQKQHDDLLEKFQSESAKQEKQWDCRATIVDELRTRVTCLEENDCGKTLPDLNEVLDLRLQTLQHDFVTRPVFAEEMRRMWEVVNTEPPLKELHSQMQTLLQKDAVIKADFAAETHRLQSVETSRRGHTRSRDTLKDVLLKTLSPDRISNSGSSIADVRTTSPTRTSSIAVQGVKSSPLRAIAPNTSSLYSPRRSVTHTELGLPPRLSSQPGVPSTARTVQPSTPPSHLHSSVLQSTGPLLSARRLN